MTQESIQERPLVTFALFAYNQEKYIREAIEGAFAQTYEPLEIILSDDCSTDRTFEIMKSVADQYNGPHKIYVRKNQHNLGIAAHFNLLMRKSQGSLVIVAAGDDISFPERTKISVDAFRSIPDISIVEVAKIDFHDGAAESTKDLFECKSRDLGGTTVFTVDDYIAGKTPSLCGAARAVDKKDWMIFGDLNSNCPTEDTPSVLRLLIRGQGVKVHKCGVARRIHENNLSGPSSIKNMDLLSIKDQYLNDINVAKYLSLIDHKKSKILNKWACRMIERRNLTKGKDIVDGSFFSYLLKVIFSQHISVREKGYFIRRILSGGF